MPLIDADLSQIEWRVAAFLSQDPVMIEEINSGVDQHAATCVHLMEMELTKENRTTAKIFNFRMIYRGSPYAFYMDPRMPNFSLKKWEGIVEAFFEKYKGLNKWHQQIIKEVYKTGRLTIPTGREYEYEKKLKKDGSRGYKVTEIVNYPVQGFAADIMHLAMVQIKARLRDESKVKIMMQVHDSIIIDVPDYLVDKVADTCYTVFIELPISLKKYFGIDFNVNLAGEVDVCIPTWKNAETIRK